jgi:NitT/TauT family transport system permease protein
MANGISERILGGCKVAQDNFRNAFTPNATVSYASTSLLVAMWFILACTYWVYWTSPIIPKPVEVWDAFKDLWFNQGLYYELQVSILTNIKALFWTAVLSLIFSYLVVVPAIRPITSFLSNLRFQGMAGLIILFTLSTSSGHQLKIALMVFGMMVFFVTSMSAEIAAIPQEEYDHARTLRMSRWRVVWEVVILGRAHMALEIFRQNAAMGWMMLTMVEGLVRSEGGIGAMLMNDKKHFNYSSVFAIQFVVLLIGIIQDYSLGLIAKLPFIKQGRI